MYSFATLPDITFFFKVPLETAISRILEGRPALKYHEAGMDLGLSSDPYESFRIFQGMIDRGYDEMAQKFGFTIIDASQPVDKQQQFVRQIVAKSIDLPAYKWRVRRKV